MIGFFLAIILIISALTGSLDENCGDDNTASSQVTDLDDKGMEENAKNIAKHWEKKYHATPKRPQGF